MSSSAILAQNQGSIVKINGTQEAHFIPKKVRTHNTYKKLFKFKNRNIVELYPDRIVIRPKTKAELKEGNKK